MYKIDVCDGKIWMNVEEFAEKCSLIMVKKIAIQYSFKYETIHLWPPGRKSEVSPIFRINN